MKSNTKSSITLPPEELALVEDLRLKLKVRTKVEVVRRGLRMLKESTDRASIRKAYEVASRAVRRVSQSELEDLDHLAGENVE